MAATAAIAGTAAPAAPVLGGALATLAVVLGSTLYAYRERCTAIFVTNLIEGAGDQSPESVAEEVRQQLDDPAVAAAVLTTCCGCCCSGRASSPSTARTSTRPTSTASPRWSTSRARRAS